MKRYVLCCLLTDDLLSAYFLSRKNPPYAGLLNGFGGTIEPGETTQDAVLRELTEETGVLPSELKRLGYLMTVSYPSGVEMAVYYAVLAAGKHPVDSSEEGSIVRLSLTAELLAADNPHFAGEGNLAYFLNYALLLEKEQRSSSV